MDVSQARRVASLLVISLLKRHVGGMIAYVKDGDMITIDVDQRELRVAISKSELTKRKKGWQAPEPRYKKGVMAKYARSVSSASEGAITN